MKNILRMALVLPLVYSVAAHAEIYRWIDQNGVTHYSDVKPDAANKKPANDGIEIIEYSFSRPEKKAAENDAVSEIAEKPTLKEQDATETTQQKKRQVGVLKQTARQDKCKDLRLQYAALQEKGAPVFEDETGNYRLAGRTDLVYSGERTYLSDSNVADRLKTVNAQIKETCSGSDDESLQKKVRADWIRAEYCELNKYQLGELKKPEARTAESSIKAQQEVVSRYCDELKGDERRDDENYYPQQLPQVAKKYYSAQ